MVGSFSAMFYTLCCLAVNIPDSHTLPTSAFPEMCIDGLLMHFQIHVPKTKNKTAM